MNEVIDLPRVDTQEHFDNHAIAIFPYMFYKIVNPTHDPDFPHNVPQFIKLNRVHDEMDAINHAKLIKEVNDRIDTWMLVGKRLGVCKDIRKLIAQKILSYEEDVFYYNNKVF